MTRSRLAQTALLMVLALVTYGGLTERAISPVGYDGLQGKAEDYLKDVRKRALEVFVAARAANGVIAVVESMQVGPVVVEGKPGMLLEPVREVVDQLGEMMTVSVVTLEALEIGREIGRRISFRVFIPLGLLILAAGLWRPGRLSFLTPLGKGVLVVGAMLAVGLPLTIWAEEGIARSLLQDQYDAAYQNVSQIRTGLGERLSAVEQPPPPDAEQPSLLARAGNWLRDMAKAARASSDQGGMEQISQWLNDKVESALKLMTIFLVEVFLLPSILGYAIYRALRSLLVRVMTTPERLLELPDEPKPR